MAYRQEHIAAKANPVSNSNIVVGEIIAAKNAMVLTEKLRARYSPVFFQLAADIIAISLTVFLIYFLRLFSSDANPALWTPDVFDILMLLTANLLYWHLSYWLGGLYKNWYIRSPFDEFFAVIKASAISSALIFFIITIENGRFSYKLLLYPAMLITSVCIMRFIARRVQRRLRINRVITLRTIMIGRGNALRELYSQVMHEPAWGYDVNGIVLCSEEESHTWKEATPVIGMVDNIEKILDVMKPGVVLVALDSSDHDLMLRITSQANDRGITVKIVPDLYEIVTGQVKALQIYGSPLIEVNPELLKTWEEAVKRLFDIFFSAMVLLLGMPVWLLIALIIKLESKGPALFSQLRVGRHGQIFRIYKFRSMVQDAELQGQQWTKVGDPRVTRFGFFLRKSHLDEIPQMWNIFKGEMSLVGPRPEQPRFVEKFAQAIPYYNRRHKVRPGLTGWWQVKYTQYEESLQEIEDRLRYDFFYIENMSLRLDIEIIVRTVLLMFKGHGQA